MTGFQPQRMSGRGFFLLDNRKFAHVMSSCNEIMTPLIFPAGFATTIFVHVHQLEIHLCLVQFGDVSLRVVLGINRLLTMVQ
jgi:hypothetical protein